MNWHQIQKPTFYTDSRVNRLIIDTLRDITTCLNDYSQKDTDKLFNCT